jgi:hypothetical protein
MQKKTETSLLPIGRFMGPSTTPGGYTGMGRVNCMAFHPTDVNTFWVGTPSRWFMENNQWRKYMDD